MHRLARGKSHGKVAIVKDSRTAALHRAHRAGIPGMPRLQAARDGPSATGGLERHYPCRSRDGAARELDRAAGDWRT